MEGILAKVDQIAAKLGIANAKAIPIRTVLKEANELMGLPSEGTIVWQVDALIGTIWGRYHA